MFNEVKELLTKQLRLKDYLMKKKRPWKVV